MHLINVQQLRCRCFGHLRRTDCASAIFDAIEDCCVVDKFQPCTPTKKRHVAEAAIFLQNKFLKIVHITDRISCSRTTPSFTSTGDVMPRCVVGCGRHSLSLEFLPIQPDTGCVREQSAIQKHVWRTCPLFTFAIFKRYARSIFVHRERYIPRLDVQSCDPRTHCPLEIAGNYKCLLSKGGK